MDESSRQPSTPFRKYALPVSGGGMLMVLLLGAACVYVPYKQEQQIAAEIESLGGRIDVTYSGPTWAPKLVREKLPFWNHIKFVNVLPLLKLEFRLGWVSLT